jgi:hypothetical protein
MDIDESFKDDQEMFTVLPASLCLFELRAKFMNRDIFFHHTNLIFVDECIKGYPSELKIDYFEFTNLVCFHTKIRK